MLSPHTALDYVRPRPTAALIPPDRPSPNRQPLPYFDAPYDTGPGLGLVLPRLAQGPAWEGVVGRSVSLDAPYGLGPKPPPYDVTVDLRPTVYDVPLTLLAGFRRAPGGPGFADMLPRERAFPEPPGAIGIMAAETAHIFFPFRHVQASKNSARERHAPAARLSLPPAEPGSTRHAALPVRGRALHARPARAGILTCLPAPILSSPASFLPLLSLNCRSCPCAEGYDGCRPSSPHPRTRPLSCMRRGLRGPAAGAGRSRSRGRHAPPSARLPRCVESSKRHREDSSARRCEGEGSSPLQQGPPQIAHTTGTHLARVVC